MNNILNAQEAFAAVITGRNVLARLNFGNEAEEFAPISNFPADIYAKPHVEYCIQIETIELAGITFTKPLTIDEYQNGQDVFVICTHSPSIYVVDFKTNALVESINAGFVQRDDENAKLQLKAISKALGHELNGDVSIIRLGKEPTKPKRKKEPEAKIRTVDDDTSLDDILGPVGIQSPSPNTADPELSVLCDAFIAEIDSAKSENDLKAIRTRINSNGDLTEVESAELATRLNLKSASFEKEQSTVSFENVAAAAVAHAQKLDAETQQKNSSGKSNNDEYQNKLATLKQRVDESKTPTEVNAVVKYTNDWSEDQRATLLQYMHKRLEELHQNKAEVAPSLIVRIQNAPDLTELDALEIDVSSLDPVIQPEMMRYIRTRRLELEKASTAAINDEDLP